MYRDYETLKVSRERGVTTVAFNRPEVKNATHPKMHQELMRIFPSWPGDLVPPFGGPPCGGHRLTGKAHRKLYGTLPPRAAVSRRQFPLAQRQDLCRADMAPPTPLRTILNQVAISIRSSVG